MDTCWTPIGSLLVASGVITLLHPNILIFPQPKANYTPEDMSRGWALYAATLGSVLITLNTTGIFISLLVCFVSSILWHGKIVFLKEFTLHHIMALIVNFLAVGGVVLTYVLCDKDFSTNETWWPALVAMLLAFVALLGGVVITVCFTQVRIGFPKSNDEV